MDNERKTKRVEQKQEVRVYFAKSASQPVTASKTPESVSYRFVRTKSGKKSITLEKAPSPNNYT